MSVSLNALMSQIKTLCQTAKSAQFGAAIWDPLIPEDRTECTSLAKRNEHVGTSPPLCHPCRLTLIPHPFSTPAQLQVSQFHSLLFLPVSVFIQLVGEPMAWGLEIEITEIESNKIFKYRRTLFFSLLWLLHRWKSPAFLCEVKIFLVLTRLKGKAGRQKGKQVKNLSKKV